MLWQTTLSFRAMAPMTLVFPLRPERGADTSEYRPFGSAFKHHLGALASDGDRGFGAEIRPRIPDGNRAARGSGHARFGFGQPSRRCLRALFKPARQLNICSALDADHLP
jgi:hypothetical protein